MPKTCHCKTAKSIPWAAWTWTNHDKSICGHLIFSSFLHMPSSPWCWPAVSIHLSHRNHISRLEWYDTAVCYTAHMYLQYFRLARWNYISCWFHVGKLLIHDHHSTECVASWWSKPPKSRNPRSIGVPDANGLVNIIQWIGFVGKIFTGNHRDFPMKYGVFRLRFSQQNQSVEYSSTIDQLLDITSTDFHIFSEG